MIGWCLGDLIFGIGQYFEVIQVVFKNIFDHHIGRFLDAQGALASAFEAFIRVLFGQADQAQAGVIGLFLEDFSLENKFRHFCTTGTDFSSLLEEVFCRIPFNLGIMLMIGWSVFSNGGVAI